MFQPNRNHLNFDLKSKLNGTRLYPTEPVKYLGVNTNGKFGKCISMILLWNLLGPMQGFCDYVNHNTLKLIYFTLFESHTNYASIM